MTRTAYIQQRKEAEENERLRARVAELERIADDAIALNHQQAKRFADCEAERDRYREALERIADGRDPLRPGWGLGYDAIERIAEEALEAKP